MCSRYMGIEHSTTETTNFVSHLEILNQHRSLPFAIAYHMLETVEAEAN